MCPVTHANLGLSVFGSALELLLAFNASIFDCDSDPDPDEFNQRETGNGKRSFRTEL
jgi:hypothetical protein